MSTFFSVAVLGVLSNSGAQPLPDFVQTFVSDARNHYSLPRGKLESSLLDYLEASGQSASWSITGDFNGDDIQDWAGLLRFSDGKLHLVALCSVGNSHSSHVLAKPGRDNNDAYFAISLEPPGTVHGFPLDDGPDDPTVDLEYQGIHLHYYEKSSVLYYWAGAGFHELWTSD